MRYFLLFALIFVCSVSIAEDANQFEDNQNQFIRPRVAEAPGAHRQEFQELMEKTANACNSDNFAEFMSCFTKKMGQKIRKTMKDLFVKHKNTIEMQILEVEPIKVDDNVATFNLKYSWDAADVPQKSIITAVITAKKEDGTWKVDSEEVKSSLPVAKNATPNQNRQINFGGGGQVELMPAGDEFLPRDIAKRPGGGCRACQNGVCEVK